MEGAMRIAETVTFGGAGVDRAANLRGDQAALERLLADPSSRVLPIWRGKPLTGANAAGWLVPGHPALQSGGAPLFLGIGAEGAHFAQDISSWEPDTGADLPGSAFVDPTEQHHPDLPEDLCFRELRVVMTRLSPVDAELIAAAKALLGWHSGHGFCAACGTATAMTHGGWQRSCPSCGTSHFPRTDPVVIMLITNGDRVLLGRSAAWPEGMYSLLAGFMEPGETIEAAVRREVAEEVGVRVGAVRYLASQPWPYPTSLMIGCAGLAETETITPDPTEIEDARWISRDELATVFAGAHPSIRAPRSGAIAGFLLRNWLADRLD
jgi:NAD+ diphosphatase